MDSPGQGEIARDSQGRPILDRYGRPVRVRPQARQTPPTPRTAPVNETRVYQPSQTPPRQTPPRQTPPRQMPPRQTPPRQVPPQQQYQQPGQIGHLRPQPPVIANGGGRRRKAISFKPRGCLGSLAGLVAVVLVLAFVVALWADAKLNRVDATPATQVANTAGTNWLLVGSDSRQGLSEEDIARLGTGGDIGVGRTDTIMVLHMPRTGEPMLLSIPRDSYVNVPGWGMDKANAAFSVGGPELLTQTVEEATGLRIDHYAEIGMGGLANMVDAVGGVEMCPAEAMYDPLANLDIQAGCQEFDGATALGYVRTRATSLGDLDRVVRQREFFSALLSTATSPGTLLNPFRTFPMISNAVGTFTVGEGDHVWHLARLALAMRGGIVTETVPIASFADYDVGNVAIWDEAGAEALFSSMR
ncbi:LCP family protein [Corynebacterium glutamicum]|uniref:LCP family protein n=1 Tax=Corynebacterium glutamicum TaxID=1718 RepID=UPI001644D69B|nr:LCP family protein [Corynebacterium glutamicum]